MDITKDSCIGNLYGYSIMTDGNTLTISRIYCPTKWPIFNYKFHPIPNSDVCYDLHKFMMFVRNIPDNKVQVSEESQKNYNHFATKYGCDLLDWKFTNMKNIIT